MYIQNDAYTVDHDLCSIGVNATGLELCLNAKR